MSLLFDPKTSLISNVRFIESPNCNERPPNTLIDLIVIHGITVPTNEFGGNGIVELFTNQLNVAAHPEYLELAKLHVSAHILIRRTGEMLQFVPFVKRAWHAGESEYAGRKMCNDFSIGIELEGSDELPYELVQYQQLAELIWVLKQVYPAITNERITGHSDIAPGRKTDPGPSFNWDFLRNLLLEKSTKEPI